MATAKDKSLGKASAEPLNAWGQDAKTAKAERKRLRTEKKMKSFMKGHEARYKAGY